MSKRMWIPAMLTVAAALSALAADPAPAPNPSPAAPAIGAAAPEFKLADQDGKMVDLADYKGKVVVLEWINKDCPIDRRVLNAKTMVNLYAKYKDKVAWFAIDSTAAHKPADYETTIKEFDIKYPVLDDAKGTVGHLYHAETTPHMFIINSDGKLVYMGGIDNDPMGTKATKVNYVDQALTELLAGKAITSPESKPYGCSVKYGD